MNSHAIRLGIIQQLPPLGQYSSSGKSKNSYFGKITHLVKETKKDVETSWSDIPEEEREALKSIAYAVFNPVNDDNSSKRFFWKCPSTKWKTSFFVVVAIVTGQIESVVEAHLAVLELADAIMEAVEREEAGLTALFLDKITEDAENNPSKLVPFTKEMNEKLEQLLNGVELD